MHLAHILALGVLCQVVAGAIGFFGLPHTGRQQPHTTQSPPKFAAAPTVTYSQHVQFLDRWVADLTARTQRDPRSWLAWESLANTYRERALFTGTTIDLTRAEDAMTQSFQVAGPGAGPYLSRASLHATLHRFTAAEADLDRAAGEIPLDVRHAASIAALRATIAFQTGRYAMAFTAWDRSLSLFSTPSTLVALADALACTGEPAAAADMLQRARLLTHERDPHTEAWVMIQKGIFEMERGRWAEAADDFNAAEKIIPGWWFTASRQAELLARRGDHAAAIVLYTELVQQTGKPELMDALAAELRVVGDRTGAEQTWSTIAGMAYDDLLQRHPEAAYGHALDHFLAQGSEPTRLISIAEKNVHLRPGGEALMKLAHAYLIGGRLPEAVATMEKVLDSPYATAAVHRLAAKIFTANGDPLRAQAQASLAREIDPHE